VGLADGGGCTRGGGSARWGTMASMSRSKWDEEE
jgi:hypothetical protein